MKRFVLERSEDVSGISGTGSVAEGVIASDGRVAIFWPLGTAFWNSLEELLSVHGHGGRTTAVILDDPAVEAHCELCHDDSQNPCPVHLTSACPACIAMTPEGYQLNEPTGTYSPIS